MHLLIPFASSLAPPCQQAMPSLKLPHLDRLLRQLTLTSSDTASANTLSPPHERALARLHSLTDQADGLLPWAALQATQSGLKVLQSDGWAIITPCHWALQSQHITLADPAQLQLTEADSRALMADMQPYFAEDGIALHYDQPTRWLAQAPLFADLPTASLDRAVGQDIEGWTPKSPAARNLRRLQQEMQMLLYTHAITDARTESGLIAVNSFWVSGSGSLEDTAPTALSQLEGLRVLNDLRQPALADDWPAWCAAWQALDNGSLAQAWAACQQQQRLQITLCGQQGSITYANEPRSLATRLTQTVRNKIVRLPPYLLNSSL